MYRVEDVRLRNFLLIELAYRASCMKTIKIFLYKTIVIINTLNKLKHFLITNLK